MWELIKIHTQNSIHLDLILTTLTVVELMSLYIYYILYIYIYVKTKSVISVYPGFRSNYIL